MAKKRSLKRGRQTPKTVLRLPDLDQAKSAVLNSPSSRDAQRGYRQQKCRAYAVDNHAAHRTIGAAPSGRNLYHCRTRRAGPVVESGQPRAIVADPERAACTEAVAPGIYQVRIGMIGYARLIRHQIMYQIGVCRAKRACERAKLRAGA
jgi:hypothetical protein